VAPRRIGLLMTKILQIMTFTRILLTGPGNLTWKNQLNASGTKLVIDSGDKNVKVYDMGFEKVSPLLSGNQAQDATL
jgi:hypothetical protein